MAKSYFNSEEMGMLNETFRRLMYFHNGNLDTKLLLLALPSEAKCLIKLGLVKPHKDEVPRVRNWYNFTELGKKFFSFYNDIKITEKENNLIANNNNLINFDYYAYKGLCLKQETEIRKKVDEKIADYRKYVYLCSVNQ